MEWWSIDMMTRKWKQLLTIGSYAVTPEAKKKGSADEEYWEINLVRSENFPKN